MRIFFREPVLVGASERCVMPQGYLYEQPAVPQGYPDATKTSPGHLRL